MSYSGITESRTYNQLNQLSNITAGSSLNLTYNYPTNGTNNGKVSSMSNAISGETVTYTYDSLNRLITAQGSNWTQGYVYDSFGNLLQKNPSGTLQGQPSTQLTVSTTNNQITSVSGMTYDLNGNALTSGISYDVENHMNGGGAPYVYDSQNERIANISTNGYACGNPTPPSYTLSLYSPIGQQKLGDYALSAQYVQGWQNPWWMEVTPVGSVNQYFGGRRVAVMDQLDSVGNYFPWGEDKGGTSPQDTWNFATYWRDSSTGLDYANNRYYSNAYGRFMTDDPSGDSWDPYNPQSWNTYAYVVGDPVNMNDPSGLQVNIPITDGGDPNSCLNQQLIPWIGQHGFTVGDNLGNFLNTSTGVLGLTLFSEDTKGSSTLYADFAQVMINRFQLLLGNGTLYSNLGLPPADDFITVIQGSSNVWTGSNLISGFENNLINVLNGSVVGPSSATNASACNQLMTAFNIGNSAVNYLSNSVTNTLGGSNVSPRTYWFYTKGADPVNHTFWNVTSQNVGAWTFETLVGPRPPRRPRRPARPPRHR